MYLVNSMCSVFVMLNGIEEIGGKQLNLRE